jgi:hypothetical protein
MLAFGVSISALSIRAREIEPLSLRSRQPEEAHAL